MWSDIVDLRTFYDRPLGRAAARLIARRLRGLWPRLDGQRVLGIGFATPYLGALRADAERVLAVMPAGQGVMRWPEGEGVGGLVALSDESALPFPDRSMDRILLVHCLEGTAEVRTVLRECWRVLADGGRLIAVVANRSGFWARAEGVPFAQGRPFSRSQITRLLRDGFFAPVATTTALFMPPLAWRLFGGWGAALEDLGARFFPTIAGVVVVEAEKQIYAVPFDAAPAAVKVRALARPHPAQADPTVPRG
jgi:SAM-dependent methyltransferase